jgi:hypothetical protein
VRLKVILACLFVALAAVVAWGWPQPAQASDRWTVWADHWYRQAERNRVHLAHHAWCLGERQRHARLSHATRRLSGDAQVAGEHYRGLATRYAAQVGRTWQRIAHPPHVTSAYSWRPCVRHFWPADAVEQALAIMRRESGGQERVMNHEGSGCAGLFQLWSGAWQGHFDPLVGWLNIKHAAEMYRACGWAPWAL